MENYITCPHCQKVITNDPLIESAVKGEGNGSQRIVCECGEMMNFWDITAQLREQKTLGAKIKKWWKTPRKASS